MKKFVKRLVLIVLFVSLISRDVDAATREVPGTYATITLAMSAASSGDIINIAAGTYTENSLNIDGKSLTFQGQGATNTIIEASATRNASGVNLRISKILNATVNFKCLTLQHGKMSNSTSDGGAIWISSGGKVTFEDCIFTKNDVNDIGGAIYIGASDAECTVLRCSFIDNTAGRGGGVGDEISSRVTVKNSTFSGNVTASVGGGVFSAGYNNGIAVYNCSFIGNTALKGGGFRIYNKGGRAELHSCLFANNTATDSYPSFAEVSSYFLVSNCVWEGAADYSAQASGGNQATVGTGNAGVNTTLADNGGPTKTHALQVGSTCIDAGSNPTTLTTDQRGTGYDRVANGTADVGAYEYGTGPVILTYRDNEFNENIGLNDGSIINSITIALLGSKQFTNAAGNFVADSRITVDNIPDGLTASIIRDSANQVTASLTGNADPHTSASNATNLTFIFNSSAFSDNDNSGVGNLTNSLLKVTFVDGILDPVLTYNGSGFSEDAANDGTIDTTWTIDLVNGTFAGANGTNYVLGGDVLVSNLPLGLAAVIQRNSDTEVGVSISGNATNHNSADYISNLEFDFKASSLSIGDASAISDNPKTGLTISYIDPVITWSGSFTEKQPLNNGSIDSSTKVVATLVGDVFVGDNGSDMLGKFSSNNVPSGLVLVVTKTSDTVATATLANNAFGHDSTDSIDDMIVAFGDTAFVGSDASEVTNNVVTNIVVTFYDAPSTHYVKEGGSDTIGAGTEISPWATITHAIGQSAEWDVIHILAGTITEKGINVSSPRVIEGDDMATTIIQADLTRGTSGGRVFNVSADAEIRNLTIQHGSDASGAGVYLDTVGSDLLLENCKITKNDYTNSVNVLYGAAICGKSASSLTLINCEVSEMLSTAASAVLAVNVPLVVSNCVITGNSAATASISVSPSLDLYSSTVSDNTTTGSGAGIGGGQSTIVNIYNSTVSGNYATTNGGGISLWQGTLNLINSTVYGNSAGSSDGGGVRLVQGIATIKNSTIMNNAAPNGDGGGIYNDRSSFIIESTIVAGNTAAVGPDYRASYLSDLTESNNIVGDNTDGAGSHFAGGLPNVNDSYVGTNGAPVDPMVLPLADNGGLTETCELQKESLAINNGSNSDNLVYDQRGEEYARVMKGAIDIGAFEFAAGPPKGWMLLIR